MTDQAEPIDDPGDEDVVETTVVKDPVEPDDGLPVAELVTRDSVPPNIAGTDLAVVPSTNELSSLAQMAVTLSAAQIVPAALRDRPNDVLLVLLSARDLGVGLTTALREFHVIDGKVTISPKVKLAMVRAQGLGKVWPDPGNDIESATWYAERADMPGVVISSTFSQEDAARPSGRNALTGKDNWRNYPQRMLSWRALGYLLDDVFGEIGTGLYSPDELGAITDENGEPVIDIIASAEPLPGHRGPRGQVNRNAPEPDPIDPDKLAEIQTRIAGLATLVDARAALLNLWTAAGPDGVPKLPRPEALLATQVRKAEAMLDAVEKRATAGEFGDWNPAPGCTCGVRSALVSRHDDDCALHGGAYDDGAPIDSDHRDPDEDVSTPAAETPPPGPEPDPGPDTPETPDAAAAQAQESLSVVRADDAAVRFAHAMIYCDDGNVLAWLMNRAKNLGVRVIRSEFTDRNLAAPVGNPTQVRDAYVEAAVGWIADAFGSVFPHARFEG